MEQLDYTLLFRWFVGRNPDDPIWVPSVFSKNRERLIDGTLLDAWASQKRVQPKDPAARPPSDDGDQKNPTITFRWCTSWMSGGIRSCLRPRMPSCGASNGRGCTRRDFVGGAAHARRIRARLTPSARGGAGECSQHTLVQPDVYVTPLFDGRRPSTDDERGHPLLFIEVLSPGTARFDRVVKRERYLRAGIEYWIVDLDSRSFERWLPGEDRPTIHAVELVWTPAGASAPLVISLDPFFTEVLGPV
jgi:hypothetical protein